MNNQERNREALIEHIAEQDRIIRRRNEQIENQARNAGEAQRAIDEQAARNYSLAADLAAAVVRAEKAEKERDNKAAAYEQLLGLFGDMERSAIRWKARAEQPRPLTPDAITDEMVERAGRTYVKALRNRGYTASMKDSHTREVFREALTAALAPPPARPEGAEKVEKVLRHYWNGDIDGDDLADRIAEEMNR